MLLYIYIYLHIYNIYEKLMCKYVTLCHSPIFLDGIYLTGLLVAREWWGRGGGRGTAMWLQCGYSSGLSWRVWMREGSLVEIYWCL